MCRTLADIDRKTAGGMCALLWLGFMTPLSALAGGALIGLSASLLLTVNGRVAGISGIASGLLRPQRGEVAWRLLFVAGLAVGGVVLRVVRPESFASAVDTSPAIAAIAGLIVGVGTTLANGCTSGHGVCGISRFSKRSIVATGVFMLAGIATTFVARHLLGGGV